jgi:MSHA biogenesis protein MshL
MDTSWNHRVTTRWTGLSGWLLTAGIVFLLSACAAPQPRPVSNQELTASKPAEEIEREKQRRQPPRTPIPEVPRQTQPILLEDPRRYTLTFQNAALGDVLSALMKDTEYNLTVEGSVDLARGITVRINKVSLPEALDMIVVEGAGYAWSLSGNTLQIRRFMEKEYHLDHLDLTGETNVEVGGDLLASGAESSSVAGKYQVKAKRPEQGSDLWQALAETLQGFKSEEGSLRINRNAGVIFIIDTPARVRSMVRFLDLINASLNRQVFIEAKIVEVILKDEQKAGIDWTKFNIQFTSGSSVLPDIFTLDVNSEGSIVKSNISRFSAVLDFLRTQGDVSVIANPHISAMNRQPAVFTVGSQFPFTDIDGVDRDLESGVVTIGTTIKRALLGVQLGITPLVSSDGIVTLHIVPTLTRIQREVELKIPTAGVGASPVITNPVIDLQELATMVRVRDGESVVLAGLISKIKRLQDEGLPILKDLPYVGSLFKHRATTDESAELVILMTPHIKEVR